MDQGVITITRRPRGDDIDAACGQLAGDLDNKVRVPLGQKMGKKSCSVNTIEKVGDTFVSKTDCKFGETRSLANTVFTGDFKTSYQAVVTSRTEPPLAGKKETKLTMKGKWLGPCEAGQKPGDLIMQNGETMSMGAK